MKKTKYNVISKDNENLKDIAHILTINICHDMLEEYAESHPDYVNCEIVHVYDQCLNYLRAIPLSKSVKETLLEQLDESEVLDGSDNDVVVVGVLRGTLLTLYAMCGIEVLRFPINYICYINSIIEEK